MIAKSPQVRQAFTGMIDSERQYCEASTSQHISFWKVAMGTVLYSRFSRAGTFFWDYKPKQ
jgi:hypothetical protein